MANATYDEIQSRATMHLTAMRNTLSAQLDEIKRQYRFSCDNYGPNSAQSGRYDKIICAVQIAIAALEDATQ